MKAIVVDEPGGPEQLKLRDVPEPELGRSRVLVSVKAAALNRADLLQRRGVYDPPPGASSILGLECAGVVTQLGDGVRSVKVGDRVMALLSGGGYAERVVIHERMAIPIPHSMSFAEAAAVPEAFLTAFEALFERAQLETGQTVLINGAAGGVGSAAVQLARGHGARVIAIAGNGDKLAKVKELGADLLINHKLQDFEAV
ncbi:MAG TPA: zinc-binding dehydrogenase, partial [Polyangiaceae bacterium]